MRHFCEFRLRLDRLARLRLKLKLRPRLKPSLSLLNPSISIPNLAVASAMVILTLTLITNHIPKIRPSHAFALIHPI